MQTSARYRVLLVMLLVVSSIGCRSTKRAKWIPPTVASLTTACATKNSDLAKAELAFAHAVALEKKDDPSCVDFFFRSATLSWLEIQRQLREDGMSYDRAPEVYRSSLAQLILTGQRYGQFDPKRGLDVRTEKGLITIPTNYYGFPWKPDDFDHLVPVGEYSTKELKTKYRNCGQGVPVVAIHCRKPQERFRRDEQAFAATVLLRPTEGPLTSSGCPFVLELYDPLRVSSITMAGRQVDLQRDITAPFAYRLSTVDREYLKAFLQPGATTQDSGLFTLEPYQPGKIPIVFVHGLLSDPFTWANMANEMREKPGFLEKYQLWGFEYATGEPFLKSAATLREQLQEIVLQIDATGSDAALSKTVLVGHSMGGLIAKLQITFSGDELWNSVSCQPLDNINTTPETRLALSQSFYFDPVPMVSRVIFVGTPHRGSPWARRPIGRLGSKLVEEPSTMEERHQQLVRDNPSVFSREFTQRIPTSIDLLEPNSPLLRAIDALPRDRRVQIHSIVGYGYRMLGARDSDKVVPVSSARHRDVVSEKFVKAKHTQIHQSSEGIGELLCILKKHLQTPGPVAQ